MNIVYWPAFSRTAVMLVGPEGVGTGAWPLVVAITRKKMKRLKDMNVLDIAIVVVVGLCVCGEKF